MHKDPKKRILKLVLILLILIITSIIAYFLISKHQTEQANYTRELQSLGFKRKAIELDSLIQTAVKIEYKGHNQGSLIFEIQNNTNQPIKDIYYEGFFKDEFGVNLESKGHSFTYKSVSNDMLILPGSKIEILVNFNDLSETVAFDFNRYLNHLNVEFETYQFVLSDGEQFFNGWSFDDTPYPEINGPQKYVISLRKLLK